MNDSHCILSNCREQHYSTAEHTQRRAGTVNFVTSADRHKCLLASLWADGFRNASKNHCLWTQFSTASIKLKLHKEMPPPFQGKSSLIIDWGEMENSAVHFGSEIIDTETPPLKIKKDLSAFYQYSLKASIRKGTDVYYCTLHVYLHINAKQNIQVLEQHMPPFFFREGLVYTIWVTSPSHPADSKQGLRNPSISFKTWLSE